MATAPARKLTRQEILRKRRTARERWRRARIAEKTYTKRLRQIAKQVGVIVEGMAPQGVVKNFTALNNTLRAYASMIQPWAKAVAESFVTEVGQRDERAWFEVAQEMGRDIRMELRTAPTGQITRKLMQEQVDLITSLPTKAADRVHHLVLEGLSSGARAEETAREIMKTGHVTMSRARLIARTETGRASTSFTESRARHIGSDGYYWRTADDSDVREEHKKLNGQYIRWSHPPIAGSNGMRYHAGAGPNCRCYAEPVIPDVIQ